jgi:hypothetical protein
MESAPAGEASAKILSGRVSKQTGIRNSLGSRGNFALQSAKTRMNMGLILDPLQRASKQSLHLNVLVVLLFFTSPFLPFDQQHLK